MHPFDDPDLWARSRPLPHHAGRPALFLDRDGVIVEEVGFLRRVEDVRLTAGIAAAIGAANRAGVAVVCVTNQSGIARGRFGWAAYQAVTRTMEDRLQAEGGATLDAIFACGHHPEGSVFPDGDRHGWRKPAPGMLLAARDALGIDLARSIIIGDRVSDLQSGLNAGLRRGILVLTGYGREHSARVEAKRDAWGAVSFRCEVVEQPAAAVARALTLLLEETP